MSYLDDKMLFRGLNNEIAWDTLPLMNRPRLNQSVKDPMTVGSQIPRQVFHYMPISTQQTRLARAEYCQIVPTGEACTFSSHKSCSRKEDMGEPSGNKFNQVTEKTTSPVQGESTTRITW
ncbi:hypothetical protein BDV33DRAFT_183604 [Aspergillus novoparasiticus]|uniref:Uncharacterized protein n=1 Tax=Aspergillus novoparasiticus TaxID=986946 RepID=A0A5N6E9C5_9EURO|nr:hypothetical protein BDV33DRAFT_183604 [Aspergillus novoparasiticus]